MKLHHQMFYLGSIVLLAGCGGGAQAGNSGGGAKKPPTAFPVQTAPVEARAVEYAISGVGSVEAFERVQITARVAGVLEKVGFLEGDHVGQGQALAGIDVARFQIAVKQAEAQVAKAQAATKEARESLTRREAANQASPGIVREEEVAQGKAKVDVLLADEKLAEVALEKAQIDLRDAQVRAPVGGIIETRTAQTGQYVQAGTVLGTLVRREPLLIRFQVPVNEAVLLKPGQKATFRVQGGLRPLQATIFAVPDAADPATRMVAVSARVTERERDQLRPGSFAEVSVPVGGSADAPVVPQVAVRPSEKGFLAFVVEKDQARERVVELGLRTLDGFVEVRSGIRVGEELVVRGAEALREGVAVKRAGEPPPSATTREPGVLPKQAEGRP